MTDFTTKDSGQHQEYASGMRRDTQKGKPRFALMWTKLQPYEQQMVTRYAALLARGAAKYDARNWENGDSQEELERAEDSLLRHTAQLVAGETDEDHAAAVWFNTQAVEYFRWRIAEKAKLDTEDRTEFGHDDSLIVCQYCGDGITDYGDMTDWESTGDFGGTGTGALTERSWCAEAPDHKHSPRGYILDEAETPPPAFVDEGAAARKRHQDTINAWHNRPVTEALAGLPIVTDPALLPDVILFKGKHARTESPMTLDRAVLEEVQPRWIDELRPVGLFQFMDEPWANYASVNPIKDAIDHLPPALRGQWNSLPDPLDGGC
jgi:dATP/dGTP diphosphohydrolase